MTRSLIGFVLSLALVSPLAGCAAKVRPAPLIAAAEVPLVQALSDARKQVEAMGKAGQIPPAEELKIQEKFSEMFAAVPKLNAGLKLLDAAQTSAEQVAAAEGVDKILESIDVLLIQVLTPISSEPVRVQVSTLLRESSRLILAITRAVAQIRPTPAPTPPPNLELEYAW